MNSSQVELATVQPLKFGSILSRTFSTIMKKPLVFFGLAVLSIMPSTIAKLLFPEESAVILMKFVDMLLTLIIQGALAYAVYQVLTRQAVQIGDSLSHAGSRIGALFLTALATGLATWLGTMLFVIPGIILMCRWAVTIPACVVERLGTSDSMVRSAELTRGSRWTIFWLVLVGFAFSFIICGLIGAAIGAAVALISSPDNIPLVIWDVVGVVPVAYLSVMMSIIYFDLRANKEGVAVDGLTNVFD